MGITSIYIMLSIIMKFASSRTECGIKISSSRIVGGKDSGGYHYPWFALLVLKNNEDIPICAGSLITPRHILTAAHCFIIKPSTPKENLYNVLMGVYDRCIHDEPNRQIFSVTQVFVHEEYNPQNKFYDIAALTLNRPADYTVICLPIGTGGGSDETEPAVLIGFGVTKEGGHEAPCRLMEAHVTKYSKTDCKRSDLPWEDIKQKTVICAGKIQGGVDSCQGDSGGPLQTVADTGQYILTGIVSYGYGCANPGLPGLYTNVASYLNWIEDKISGSKMQRQNFHINTQTQGDANAKVTFPDGRTITARGRKMHTSGGTVRFPGQNSAWNEYFKNNERTTGRMSTVSFPKNS